MLDKIFTEQFLTDPKFIFNVLKKLSIPDPTWKLLQCGKPLSFKVRFHPNEKALSEVIKDFGEYGMKSFTVMGIVPKAGVDLAYMFFVYSGCFPGDIYFDPETKMFTDKARLER